MELRTNKEYTLREIFSTQQRKIIIPDFQRDYCWGDKTHGEKHDTDIVSGFLDTLINDVKSDVLLGKIDVYEHPKNHIYLTDGQQRLTSLYLIIGMLYRKVKDEELKNKLKRCLISDYEGNQDEKEPYLQYAVRESTVFLMRDLVNEFFIKENALKVSDIQNQSWYFREYDLDPSIISILSALGIIEKKIEDKETKDFAEFIINKIKIQYYDVQDKKHGEERFVIINTTGKSLTVSENIKPILLGNIGNSDFAKQWEERETWFWKNRNKENENIADDGVNQFLTWCFQIEDKQVEVDIIKKSKDLLNKKKNEDFLKAIHKHFESLKQVIEYLKDDTFQKQFKFINDNKPVEDILDLRGLSKDKIQNVLLPLLSFISKFGNDKQMCYQFLRRLRKNHFDWIWEDRKKNYIDWRYVLQIIEKSDTQKFCLHYDSSFESIGKVELPKSIWFNNEEKVKNALKEDHASEILEWEDHPHFMGDLNPLFNIVSNKSNLKELETFFETYNKLQLDDFQFSECIKLKNIYRLISYLYNGNFNHGSVGGWGYCMLKKSEEKRLFLHQEFNPIWKLFNNHSNESKTFQFLNEQLKTILKEQIFKDVDFESVCKDTWKLKPYERVKLWAVLEFLNTNEELNFQKSICQFWEYPNLIIIVEKKYSVNNNYEIGNLLLGTSYYNNKSGWIEFTNFPLMKALNERRELFTEDDIKKQTQLYKNLLKEILQ